VLILAILSGLLQPKCHHRQPSFHQLETDQLSQNFCHDNNMKLLDTAAKMHSGLIILKTRVFMLLHNLH
jgi:hypothetical protein